jgi:predicted RNase H-like nuclease (RuvC/YqgF family)
MEGNYEIIFENVNGFAPGDVVEANQIANTAEGLAYLVKVGAVVSTEKAKKTRKASVAVSAQIDEATESIRTELAQKDETIAELTQRVEELEADIEAKAAEITRLEAKTI